MPQGRGRYGTPSTPPLSRRDFVARCAQGAAALAWAPVLDAATGASPLSGPATRAFDLSRDWLFGGPRRDATALAPGFDDTAFTPVTLPHAVARMGWRNWDPASWQNTWIYRRHFRLPEDFRGLRVFLRFEGVMVGATPTINGHALPPHLGGYLPFSYEIGEWLREGDNLLAVEVDSRWSNVPPQGSPKGASSVDYLELGGIHRSVRLEAVPQVYLADVFAKPVRVLEADRQVEVSCTVDAAAVPAQPLAIELELRDADRVLARARQPVRLERDGGTDVRMTLSKLGAIQFWDVESPRLYRVVARLLSDGRPLHEHAVRIGFREASFTVDGFFLNGRRVRLFGLNRHEIFPYLGYAMPRRVMRRDAEILRRDFHCNIVRCSHYPQSPDFLDACDELGLMVWEEIPGWQYLGDAAWKKLALRDTRDMILRDRNRPSVVIWGTRINESQNEVELYRETRALAKALDGSRSSSGSMTPQSRQNWKTEWAEDVFAFDDYHAAPDGSVGIDEPLPGVPYLLAEAVGQFNYSRGSAFDAKYRRAGDPELQRQQALRHAQAHDRAAAHPRNSGVIAWCGFDYASLVNPYQNVKCPGVADMFRIPKLGAAFYLTQGDPESRPMIVPDFYWDFGPQTPRGPGRNAAIFSNCDRLDVSVGGRRWATLHPDKIGFPHTKHPPFFVDLDLPGADRPALRIDGYLGDRLAVSRSFSSDATRDRFSLRSDDSELIGDGSDATRLVFGVADEFGAERAFAGGEVSFQTVGPGVIVGDNPFSLAPSGGVGAVWLKTTAGGSGAVVVTARHSALGEESVRVVVRPRTKA